ncbi:hypothetical protein DSO57_1028163 [Entomophthora muscae]|uniref:Uncharacterized protein n=1 Tax=Entomophthora muscae TaxID=34485 RepID=A0ACC2SQM9_9FUNG|nr:hypothetical protein DSO57_1028163 [Entomophthora muscae]
MHQIISMTFQVSILSLLVSGLATAASLSITEIPVSDQILTKKHCNNNFGGWEHAHYEAEYLAAIRNITSTPYSHRFEGRINFITTSITIQCQACNSVDTKEIARNLWDLSKGHHCSYSQIEDRDSACICVLDYDYGF